jgi:arginase
VVAGLAAPRLGVCWLDAHADFNTPETTTTGLLDGMAMSTIVGHCWTGMLQELRGFRRVAPRDVLLVGARDLDPDEEIRLIEQGVRRHGGPRGWDGSIGSMVPDVPFLHLHLDLDVIDPAEGRANRHAVDGGLTVGYLFGIIGELRRTRRLRSATIASYDPSYDTDGRVSDAARRIAAALT